MTDRHDWLDQAGEVGAALIRSADRLYRSVYSLKRGRDRMGKKRGFTVVVTAKKFKVWVDFRN
jgi:hypothetical protein